MFSSPSEDIRRRKISQQIIDSIRNAILSGSMEPGARLPNEAQLMRHFGVSRLTMREALCALESMGLLHVRAGVNGGAFVQSVQEDVAHAFLSNFLYGRDFTIAHVTEVRLCIEPYAAERAALLMQGEETCALRCVLQDCREAMESPDETALARLRGLEMAFHGGIVRATGNPVFVLMHSFAESLLGKIKTRLTPSSSFSRQVLQSHEGILEAISARDPNAARERMRRDILDVSESLSQLAEAGGNLNLT